MNSSSQIFNVDRSADLTGQERWRWFADLLSDVTLEACGTSTRGTDGPDHSERMRRLSELIRRIANQLSENLEGRRGIPDALFIPTVRGELDALGINKTQARN